MKKSQTRNLGLVLLILAATVFGESQVAARGKKGNQNPLKNLCAAGKQFWTTYQRSCGSPTGGDTTGTGTGTGTTRPVKPVMDSDTTGTGTGTGTTQPIKPVDSTVVALCLAETGQRFLSADDITESDQSMRISMTRRLHRTDQSNFCSFEQVAHNQAVLDRLTRVLEYFDTLEHLNVNSPLLATRALQAQIAIMLEKVNFSPGQAALMENLQRLQERSKNISMKLEEKNGERWNWVDRMTSTTFFWKMPNSREPWKDWEILSHKELHPVPEFQNLPNYHTEHEANNECYLQMIKDCGLTQQCADLLMNESAILTTLGHNVRFFQLALKMECVNEVSFVDKFRARATDWQRVLESQCSLMWNEASIIANEGFPIGYKGLFLVHGTFCAFVGYPNFLQVDWMNHVMSWLDGTKNGCMSPDTKSGEGEPNGEYDTVAENGEWCSLWETSLATQLLITHFRYVLETCNQG